MGKFCKICGHENKDDFNFCIKCGNKLKTVCNCWIKKEPYNCGHKKCPGYGLYRREKLF